MRPPAQLSKPVVSSCLAAAGRLRPPGRPGLLARQLTPGRWPKPRPSHPAKALPHGAWFLAVLPAHQPQLLPSEMAMIFLAKEFYRSPRGTARTFCAQRGTFRGPLSSSSGPSSASPRRPSTPTCPGATPPDLRLVSCSTTAKQNAAAPLNALMSLLVRRRNDGAGALRPAGPGDPRGGGRCAAPSPSIPRHRRCRPSGAARKDPPRLAAVPAPPAPRRCQPIPAQLPCKRKAGQRLTNSAPTSAWPESMAATSS